MKISVLGAGGWGTTLSILLHYNGHNVSLWEFDKSYAKQLDKKRENKLFLPGIEIPEEIEITHDLQEASNDKNIIVLAVPSQYLRSVLKKIPHSQIKNSFLVNVAKGVETKTLLIILLAGIAFPSLLILSNNRDYNKRINHLNELIEKKKTILNKISIKEDPKEKQQILDELSKQNKARIEERKLINKNISIVMFVLLLIYLIIILFV